MVAAFVLVAVYKGPDVLVSADASLMGVRLPDGNVALSNVRKDSFTRSIWLRHWGRFEDDVLVWPKEGAGPGGMMCDPAGCRMELEGRRLAFSLQPEGLVADCAWADIVVADAPLRDMKCAAEIVVDRFDVWREGAHAIWLEDIRMESVARSRGKRPWTTSNLR